MHAYMYARRQTLILNHSSRSEGKSFQWPRGIMCASRLDLTHFFCFHVREKIALHGSPLYLKAFQGHCDPHRRTVKSLHFCMSSSESLSVLLSQASNHQTFISILSVTKQTSIHPGLFFYGTICRRLQKWTASFILISKSKGMQMCV